MVQRAHLRETRDGSPLAPSRFSSLLDLALAAPPSRSTATRCPPARIDTSAGVGEPDLGCAAHPRRAAHARLRSLGAQRVQVSSSTATASWRTRALADLPAQPPRRYRGHGLLHRTHGHLPHPLVRESITLGDAFFISMSPSIPWQPGLFSSFARRFHTTPRRTTSFSTATPSSALGSSR